MTNRQGLPVTRSFGRSSRARLLPALIAAFAMLATGLAMGGSTADAQTLVRRCNGLFDCLFTDQRSGARVQQAPRHRAPPQRARLPWQSPQAGGHSRSVAPSPPASQREAQPRRARHPSRTVDRAPPEPEAPAKLDNARVVLVVGDFLAGGLAEGLEQAYAGSPGVRVVDASNGSSGLVRDDYYDWNAELPKLIDEEDPAAVVVMLGSNDRQQLAVDGRQETPRSEAWVKEYDRRVERLAKIVRDRDLPLIWTGLPAFKSPSMTSDMLAFNDIYKKAAEEAGGEFADIWDGFVDENGNFVFDGPDINGQKVRLRGSDGINLTEAARRKVAYYVEKPLAKILGEAVSPDIGEDTIDQIPESAGVPGEQESPDRTAPISLYDPDLDGGSQLLGDGNALAGSDKAGTPMRKLVVKGIAPAARSGRADDFGLVDEAGPAARAPDEDTPASPRPDTATDAATTGAVDR